MNKRIVLLLMILSMIMTGCASKEVTFTLSQVKELFEKHDFTLSEPEGLHPDNVFTRTLNGVEAAAFFTEDQQLISIYIFPSGKDVKKGLEDFEAHTAAADLVPYGVYQVSNVLIFTTNDESDHIDRVEAVVVELKSLARD